MRPAKYLRSSSRKPASASASRGRSRAIPEFRRPESVLVIVHTDDLQVLLLKRIAPFEFWQSVTGSLDEDETPADGALRELCEETGLRDEGTLADAETSRVFTIDPRWRHRFAPGVTENLEHEWRYRLANAVDISIDPTEHSEWAWVAIDDAIERVWSWTNREALEALRSQKRGQSTFKADQSP